MTAEFVSLHNHSDKGSFLDGFGQVGEYVKRAAELGQRGIGMSDHGMFSSAFQFMDACKKEGIIGVPGCELYMAPQNPEGARAKDPVFYGRTRPHPKTGNPVPDSRNDVSSRGAYTHLTAWATNQEGLKSLYNISYESWKQENYYKKNRADFEMLEDNSDGLVIGTGCPSSEVSTRLLLGQEKEASEYIDRLVQTFGKDRVFMEIMDHAMEIDLERDLLPLQMKMAKKHDLELLATNDCHYVHQEDHKHHEEFLCLQSGAAMDDPTSDNGGNRFAFQGNEYYLKTAEAMAEIFPEDEYPRALSNSLLIAEMAQDLVIPYDPELMVKVPAPEGMEGLDDNEILTAILREEMPKVYAHLSEKDRRFVADNVNHEFKVISSSGYSGYFLAVREYIKWTKDNYSVRDESGRVLAEAVGIGRGSVGASYIAYILGISSVDPFRFPMLVFERFLTPGRGDTYRLTYDDGTTEDLPVASKKMKILPDGTRQARYIYQLHADDVVEDTTTTKREKAKAAQEKSDE